MKVIFLQNCDFWEGGFCPDTNLRELHKKKFKKGKEFKLPEENELKILNEICSTCKNPLRIKEKKCPLCGKIDIQPSDSASGGELISTEIYNYKCDNCDRFSYSYAKLA